MSFGILEGISLLGTVGKILNPQAAAGQTVQKTSIDRNEFMSLFQEAMSKYDEKNTVDEATAKDKLEMLFNYLDSNQDGTVSKSEFSNLASLVTEGNLKI
ncbi:MAG: EF-hand domain-containing protein [Candidatus Auribacterota bacterium]|jgi:Ca2+-binding EF-hand superfamily protein|nr:EF-hand domain-containing protein [Candidatus Auribacterota bacterium]